tara:strand:- start:375 stop:1586 length:1212 start_codon:yes stop_codon:yes gene_type:complete
MKILFLTDNFPPEMNAPATRTWEHCKEWVKQGIEVTVITCAPNFPKGKVFDGYKNKFIQSEIVDGIKVVRVWSYISSNSGFLKRIIDYISFAVMSFIVGLFHKTDIIIATSPQFFTTISGYLLSIFKRKPWVFELRDIWPESIKAVGAMKSSKLLDSFEKLELFLYRKADLIIPVTESFKSNLINRGVEASKIKVVKNGVDLTKYKPITKDFFLLKELNLSDKFVISYIGTHGMAHGLSFILSSIEKVNNDFHFLFIGGGAEKESLVRQAKTLGLTNCTFLDFVSKDEIKRYISIIDIALVNLKKSDTFKSVIPSKIFENAAMMKPILLGVQGESEEIIRAYYAGECFLPEDKEDFLNKLQLMYDEYLKKTLIYNRGMSALVTDYDRSKLALSMLDELKLIIK